MALPVSGSTLAAMASQMGLSDCQACLLPPGMSEGPKRAPSSPPETPVPMNSKPFSVISSSRRMVAFQLELPPSMKMSPFSQSGSSWAMTLSTASRSALSTAVDWTMITILRGVWSDSTNVGRSGKPRTRSAEGSLALQSAMKSSILEVVRL